jgi:hypothetical protein
MGGGLISLTVGGLIYGMARSIRLKLSINALSLKVLFAGLPALDLISSI